MENNHDAEGKYYVTDSYLLACAFRYATGQKPYIFNNDEFGRVYSFINDDNFKQARNELWKIKVKYNKTI